MSLLDSITKETVTAGLKFLATFSCGITAGSALYISCVEHPNRMLMSADNAMRNWRGCFPLAKRQGQITGSIATLSCAGVSAMMYNAHEQDKRWWAATFLLFSVTPYTILCIKPTNDILLDTETVIKEKDDKWIKEKLSDWCCLHNVRIGITWAALGLITHSILWK